MMYILVLVKFKSKLDKVVLHFEFNFNSKYLVKCKFA